MKGFICYDCNKKFDYPKVVEEYRGEYWGISAYETVGYCPHCESGSFGEVEDQNED